jgi:hypothetical protein
MRRRYEVWFLRLGLADGSGAWWFRYLLMNAGGGCPGNPRGQPAQIWATWFPRNAKPETLIQGFSRERLAHSKPRATPFYLESADNRIGEDFCAGQIQSEGHDLRWNLRYRSTFGATLSDRGWIGFSRTPHSNAIFSGEIIFDGREFRNEPLGYGLQGHNCGYRHRNLWTWTHCIFPAAENGVPSIFEALEYEMPFGLRFRKALIWYDGAVHVFRTFRVALRDRTSLQWRFICIDPHDRSRIDVEIDGSGPSLHRLPYLKTDCSSTFEVSNNSLARASLAFTRSDRLVGEFSTEGGAVLEMAGE